MNSQSSHHTRFKALPLVLMLTLSLVLAGGFFWMSSASKASANTPDINLARAAYPNIVNTRIDDCALCHAGVPNLNAYGAAYKAKGRGAASSFPAIETLDSDQDGATNIQEIMALTFPGDASDFPAIPTATKTNTPTSAPATATRTPTATSLPPVNTNTPTATSAGPTATKTATSVGPIATKTATSVGPTATKKATSTSPTATRRATETRETKVTKTPGPRPTPVIQCVKDDDDYRRKSSDDGKRSNICPPGYHPRGGDWEGRKGDDDFFKQILQRLNSMLQGKKKP